MFLINQVKSLFGLGYGAGPVSYTSSMPSCSASSSNTKKAAQVKITQIANKVIKFKESVTENLSNRAADAKKVVENTRVRKKKPAKTTRSSNTRKANEVKITRIGSSALPKAEQTLAPVVKKSPEARALEHAEQLYLMKKNDSFADVEAEDIRVIVNHCLRMVEKDQVTEQDKRDFIAIFDQLGQLPKDKFDGSFFLAGKEKMQRILSSELDALMKAHEANPALKNDKDHMLDFAIEQASLALRMGVRPKQADGCNGAVLLPNIEGELVGVFKAPPEAEGIDLMRTFKSYVGQARLFDRSNKMNEMYAEKAMYIFSEIFGIDMAPAAKTIQLQNKEGAFIAFLGKHKEGRYQPLEEVATEFDARPIDSYTRSELVIWQKTLVTMGLTLNMDGHDGNIFVCLVNGMLASAKLIDAGNCFAQSLPGQWGSKGHRAAPGQHPISSIEFLPEIKDFMVSFLTEEKFDAFVAKVSKELPGFWNPQMDQLHRMVFEKMRNGIASGQIKSPKDLLNIMTAEDFSKIESTPSAGESLTMSFVGDFDDLSSSWVALSDESVVDLGKSWLAL